MINFPNSPSQGQVFTSTTGLQYVYLDGVWRIVEAPQDLGKAESRNRIVNGAMQISQENGNTAVTADQSYPVDQFFTGFNSSATITSQRVQVTTPNGSVNRYRLTITVADAALASSDLLYIQQKIEGVRTADFQWGSASAKQVVLRFGFKGPAGTYSIKLGNSANDRSYIANFTISAGQANTDTEQVFVIPGSTTGSWLATTGIGVLFAIALAGGLGFRGVAGWQSGNFFVTVDNTNGLATAGAVFEIFDVGLYLDPNSTGAAPWTMPDEAEELRACQRYWQVLASPLYLRDYSSASASIEQSYAFMTAMRSAPGVGIVSLANVANLSVVTSRNPTVDHATIGATVTATGAAICTFGLNLTARM